MNRYHQPVMLREVIEYLSPVRGETFVDNTIGGGGHALEIVKKIMPGGKLVGMDVDEMALAAAKFYLKRYLDDVFLIKANFSRVDEVLSELSIEKIDGSLFDLGLSSAQIEESSRGFSYMSDGQLDMRMDRSLPLTAKEIVNTMPTDELSDIFRRYGEEGYAARIADVIERSRKRSPINSTMELVEIIKKAVPIKGARKGHPAKRVFQALRIYVNDEISSLRVGLKKSFQFLNAGGRMVVISYHSLEDRTVKNIFKELAGGCICPPDIPVCVCGRQISAEILTNGAVLPTSEEVMMNARSKSAKLRALRKLA
ncbi:MAG: 16S rRNA (cytosine(1402)-N(4))-methyltransferase RsmH [Actinobacteria bacterium]|nr:16S rRNA (cytosine(1402)-N(4))-methyltransferase RsmH [Actinomycetota bacterium]